ncbi:MAG TPA: LytTR family DNA-binding domain-containing protein [Chitinophagaceae bacterium]|nr:LytTR family DNA-binding domain-containing protein [Chitinophagaceae bacterium]
MKLNCIVIEDEPPAQEKLAGFIKEISFLELKQTFGTAINVASYLRENRIDLLFLDIQLGVFSGLDFLASLNQSPLVIFTTAHADYAIKSYEFNVIDYLLKPYSFQRFHQAVQKAYEFVSNKTESQADDIFVKTEYRIEKIRLADILYIEGKKDYLKIVTAQKNIMSLLSFKKMEEVLPSSKFFRVHNSYIIALDKITAIERDLVKIGEVLIPISKSNKQDFYKLIEKRLL